MNVESERIYATPRETDDLRGHFSYYKSYSHRIMFDRNARPPFYKISPVNLYNLIIDILLLSVAGKWLIRTPTMSNVTRGQR